MLSNNAVLIVFTEEWQKGISECPKQHVPEVYATHGLRLA